MRGLQVIDYYEDKLVHLHADQEAQKVSEEIRAALSK
jgi:hypothetical protein